MENILEKTVIVKLSDVCRACLIRTDNMISLLETKDEMHELTSKLAAVSNLEIQLNENLPSYLCDSCIPKLKLSYEFQQLCQRSNRVMLDCLNTNMAIEIEFGEMGTVNNEASNIVAYKESQFLNNEECSSTSDDNISDEEADSSNKETNYFTNLEENNVKDTEKCIDQTHVNLNTNNIRNTNMSHEELGVDIVKEEIKSENVSSENLLKLEKDDNVIPKLTEVDRKVNSQTMRLQQYAADEVAKVIAKVREELEREVDCNLCGFQANCRRALSVHFARVHGDVRDTWCSSCNQVFENLADHVKNVHAERDNKCEFCGKKCGTTYNFLEHLASHTTERAFKCTFCDKCFISPRHLNKHHNVHIDKTQACPYCTRRFIGERRLRKHLKSHEKILCGTCDKYIPRNLQKKHSCFRITGIPEDVEEDVKEEIPEPEKAGPRNFCKECNRKVRSVTLHNDNVHNPWKPPEIERKHLCTYCGKQFKTSSKLNVHVRIHTGETPYKCSFCPKRMGTRNQLVVHERVHTGDRPHVCSICGKSFAQTSVLNTHMKIHTGRPEQCQICLKRFCRPAELKLHMRQHTGEKPFRCIECDQAFKQKSHLVEHSKTHSSERPFICSYCGKGFKQNSSLKSHVQIHLGQKPFQCDQCPYACRQRYSLTQHMYQHNKDAPRSEKIRKCNICQNPFKSKSVLIAHYSAVHCIESPPLFGNT